MPTVPFKRNQHRRHRIPRQAGISDQRAGTRLLGGLRPFCPAIRTVMADAGHQSRKLAPTLKRHEGWRPVITKCGERAFKIKGLT